MRARPITAQDVPQSDPGACSRSRRAGCPASADARVCFLWLLSFAQAKESNSPARMAGETTHGRESVLAKTTPNKPPERATQVAHATPARYPETTMTDSTTHHD